MNGAHNEVVSTYTKLLVGLANLIDRDRSVDIVEQLRKGIHGSDPGDLG